MLKRIKKLPLRKELFISDRKITVISKGQTDLKKFLDNKVEQFNRLHSLRRSDQHSAPVLKKTRHRNCRLFRSHLCMGQPHNHHQQVERIDDVNGYEPA
jgi:hypothetical protein